MLHSFREMLRAPVPETGETICWSSQKQDTDPHGPTATDPADTICGIRARSFGRARRAALRAAMIASARDFERSPP
jgi:hypothetical protein